MKQKSNNFLFNFFFFEPIASTHFVSGDIVEIKITVSIFCLKYFNLCHMQNWPGNLKQAKLFDRSNVVKPFSGLLPG